MPLELDGGGEKALSFTGKNWTEPAGQAEVTTPPDFKAKPSPGPPRSRLRFGLAARLRAYLFAGIIVVAPISITLFITWRVVDYFDNQVAGLLPDRYNPERFLPFTLPGIGLLLTLAALIVIGWFTASYLGHSLMRLGERVLRRMPVVRSLYGTLKQIFETVFAQSSRSFGEVVLVEWPRRGAWSVAFVTGPAPSIVSQALQDELVSLFLPCTPNPTTGYYLMVARRELMPIGLSVEDAMKLIISGGLAAPAEPPAPGQGAVAAALWPQRTDGRGRRARLGLSRAASAAGHAPLLDVHLDAAGRRRARAVSPARLAGCLRRYCLPR